MGDDETKAPTGDDLDGKISTCKVRVLRAARNFAKVMAEFDGKLEFCSERMNEVLDAADRLIELETAASTNGASSPDRLTAPQPKTGTDLSDLARRPGEQTGAGDRTWWKEIYRAGMKADLDRKPRVPPEGLTDDQRDVWLAGYDR